ncbi:hypothetical protein [Kocuria sp.]|uniref:hypothetical protein n=1 Tax=Kocuria sp. TaxID=1871328 RepID=UPI0026DECD1B|nr:hypothetical protein [Kocuria sp.]MDO5617944.1 hypothetical protein [Kocuria sp.]
MTRARYRARFPPPQVRTPSEWGRSTRQLEHDPHMFHLIHSLWARFPEPLGADVRKELLSSPEIAALVQPHFGSETAVAGVSAAKLWGIPLMNGMAWSHAALEETVLLPYIHDRPQLSFDSGRRYQGRTDLLMRRGLGLPKDTALWGCRITGALETLLAVQPLLPGWKAVAAVDHILATGLAYPDPRWPITPADLQHLLDALPPYTRGASLLQRALDRSAANVWSPMETLLRLLFIAAGLPPPTPNLLVVFPDGSKAYLDLGWEEQKVGVEYNGAIHYQDRQTYGDELHRLTRFKRMGWDIHLAVSADIRQRRRREGLVTDVTRALLAR